MPTSNEADTEDKHAEREQRCTDIGQINKTIRGFGIGRQNRQEERRRNYNRGNGDRTSHKPFHGVGEFRLIYIAKRHKRSVPSMATGALAIGALALGALAIGALAIGRLRVLRADVNRLHLGTVEIDDLSVNACA
jgi:hypothetical protein